MHSRKNPPGGYSPRCVHGLCAVSFGLGMTLSCICPSGLILFLAAVILVSLGVAVIRH